MLVNSAPYVYGDIVILYQYLKPYCRLYEFRCRVRGVVADPVGVTDPKAAKSLFAEIKLISH